ncbi:hypothetical protein [Rhodococcus sp. MTM3W5.2]|uniref:hypothetical protein n=1 Tax=Rhodococcus sp. MTM3W5.2 TaxID=1805827 RepID=UPI00097C51A3|nr:hypothetical protein [Rhodococcus sp. MTM3W5.2]
MTPASALSAGPRLDPRIPILVRPSGTVQLGWDPERALLLTVPTGVAPPAVAALLRVLDGQHSRDEILRRAREIGLTAADIEALLAELAGAALLMPATTAPRCVTAVHVHGRGPISDGIAGSLADGRVRLTRSVPFGGTGVPRIDRSALVVLADELVPDPGFVAGLVEARMPHLQVRLRDGAGIVGPLVLPGHTSCLRCADLTRTSRDHEWPHLAAQLLGAVGHADPASILATTALALAELNVLIAAQPARSPACLDTTLELNLTTYRLVRRTWPRHPDCGCHRRAGHVGEPANRQP